MPQEGGEGRFAAAPTAPGTTRKLFALSLSIALAMSGVGIIIPVVPSHIGRLGPIWLASELLFTLAPVFAWSGGSTHEPPNGRAAKAKLAFGRQEAR